MEEPTNSEIQRTIKNLSGTMDEGFSSTHKRLDITNGKVVENTEFRLKSVGSLSVIKWMLGFVGFGTMALLVKDLFL